jgi:hypothetical protein
MGKNVIAFYSFLRACMGSTEAARRAGITAASAAAASSNNKLPPTANGSRPGV